MKLFNELECVAVAELMNIGVGRAAVVLSEILNQDLQLSVPSVDILMSYVVAEFLTKGIDSRVLSIRQEFSGAITGAATLVFVGDRSYDLLRLIIGEEPRAETLATSAEEALSEVGSTLLSACIGGLGTLDCEIKTGIPVLQLATPREVVSLNGKGESLCNDTMVLFLMIDFQLRLHQIAGSVCLGLDVAEVERFGQSLSNYVEARVA